ncbi:RecB family exonuclease [Patescibacteria group bacterium]
MPDKFTAVWLSHSSISDFLKCPRAYYLKNVYKDTKTGHKITLMSPALALGQTVHTVLEGLSVLPKDERFSKPLLAKFDDEWKKVAGKQGGFLDADSEYVYKKRGEEMLKRVYNNPGPIEKLSVKMGQELPQYWLSEEENLILCGKIDWLEYLPETDSVHIIDFKTGKKREEEHSLQLPIYNLLVNNCQKRKVSKASYWHLATDDKCIEMKLPDLEESRKAVLEIGRKMKLARQLKKFDCPHNGCFACKPMEKILNGEAELVGQDTNRKDVYILKAEKEDEKDSIIL